MFPGITNYQRTIGNVIIPVTPITFSYFATANSTSTNITFPSSLQAGDFCILSDMAVNGTMPTQVVPSGFTQIDQKGGSFEYDPITFDFSQTIISYKKLSGSESGTSLAGMSDGNLHKKMAIFRPNISYTNITVHWTSKISQHGDFSTLSGTISSSAASLPAIGFGIIASDRSSSSFSTQSPAFDAVLVGNSNRNTIGYKLYNSGTPTDQNVAMNTDSGDFNYLGYGYIEFS